MFREKPIAVLNKRSSSSVKRSSSQCPDEVRRWRLILSLPKIFPRSHGFSCLWI
jgi:hypothetical protein